MRREMQQIVVRTKGGEVVVEQNRAAADHSVAISVDQVPLLIEWLTEAVDEITARTRTPPTSISTAVRHRGKALADERG